MNSELLVERPLTVSGCTAILHAWELDPNEVKIDFSAKVHVVARVMEERLAAEKSKLVTIEGGAGSGKTVLASVLAATGKNTVHVNGAAVYASNVFAKADITTILSDHTKTYIIDEVFMYERDSFLEALNTHLDAGGAAVVLAQTRRDIPQLTDTSWLQLTRDGLAA